MCQWPSNEKSLGLFMETIEADVKTRRKQIHWFVLRSFLDSHVVMLV